MHLTSRDNLVIRRQGIATPWRPGPPDPGPSCPGCGRELVGADVGLAVAVGSCRGRHEACAGVLVFQRLEGRWRILERIPRPAPCPPAREAIGAAAG